MTNLQMAVTLFLAAVEAIQDFWQLDIGFITHQWIEAGIAFLWPVALYLIPRWYR